MDNFVKNSFLVFCIGCCLHRLGSQLKSSPNTRDQTLKQRTLDNEIVSTIEYRLSYYLFLKVTGQHHQSPPKSISSNFSNAIHTPGTQHSLIYDDDIPSCQHLSGFLAVSGINYISQWIILSK